LIGCKRQLPLPPPQTLAENSYDRRTEARDFIRADAPVHAEDHRFDEFRQAEPGKAILHRPGDSGGGVRLGEDRQAVAGGVAKLRLPLFGGLAIAEQGLPRVHVALVYQQGKEAHGAQDQQGNLDCQVRLEGVLAFPATHPNLPSHSIQFYALLRGWPERTLRTRAGE
jgi:hypothetical protein